MSNWFVPFYIQHPDIAQYVEKMEGFNLMKMGVEGGGTFCNSDKYSFLIVFQQMMNTLPDSLLQMLKRGEGALSMMNEMSKEEQAKPAFIRRNYLMDLYRFFMLFPNNKSLYNPYNSHEEEQTDVVFIVSDLFMHTPMDRHKPAIVKMLKKRKMNKSLALLMQSFPEEMRDQNYYLWMEDYERALEIDPENEWALVGHARNRFKAKDYEGALEIYEHLLLKYPEKKNYMLNKAVCQVNMEDYEEAQKVLYQLNYEHPEDMSVAHVLAWSLTCDGKMEQAENLYQQLMAQEAPNPSDFLNYGYSLWLQGRINEAAEQLRKYARQVAGNENTATLQLDDSWLKARGISETEICMMKTLVAMG